MHKYAAYVVFLAGLLVSCAFDLAHVSFSPAELAQPEAPKHIVMGVPVSINQAPCGYGRTLRHGSTWELVGTIPEGEVYKPKDQVLTVECSNVYEAYIVVQEDMLVGFYLPVEKGFVSMEEKMEISLKREGVE